MRKLFYPFAIIALSSVLLYSCGEEEVIEEEVTTEEEITEEITDQTEYILPSPLQIAELFKSAGLTYIGDIANDPGKVENLNEKKLQKLNFGVYSADMAYCIMNNQTQESIDYLNTLKRLSEKIWMTDVFNSLGLSKRLEANVGNEDSLTYIMADLQMRLDEYLEENGMGSTGHIVFAGAWIETMYLGVKVNESEKNEKLIVRLSEQAVILDGLINSIKQTDEDNDFADLVADLEKINGYFADYDDESVEEFVLTDEQIAALSEDVSALRSKIVGE